MQPSIIHILGGVAQEETQRTLRFAANARQVQCFVQAWEGNGTWAIVGLPSRHNKIHHDPEAI